MMNFHEKVRAMCCLLLIIAAIPICAASANAVGISLPSNSFRMRTDEPIMVENKLLPPGDYIWKRLDSIANHHIVQISNERTHHVEATVIAIPNSREQPADLNEVDYWETPKGYPRAVRAWFLPGDTFGQEFPYPTKMALILKRPSASPSLLTRPRAELVVEHLSKAKPSPQSVNASGESDMPQGSWAVITDGSPQGPLPLKSAIVKHSNTLWDGLRRLPLTATLAPLVGLVGIGALALFLMTYARRKKQEGGPSVF